MDTLSKRVQNLLDKKGHTPYSFCAATGYSDATLSRMINNNSKPN